MQLIYKLGPLSELVEASRSTDRLDQLPNSICFSGRMWSIGLLGSMKPQLLHIIRFRGSP